MFDKKTLKNELLKFYTNLEIDKYSSIGWYYSDVMESKYVQEIETANKKINESYFGKIFFTTSDILSTPGPLKTSSQISIFLHFLIRSVL